MSNRYDKNKKIIENVKIYKKKLFIKYSGNFFLFIWNEFFAIFWNLLHF